MHPSSRRAGYVGEISASVLAKHVSQRRVFRVLRGACWLVIQASYH